MPHARGKPMIAMSARLPPEVHRLLALSATATGRPMNALIIEAVSVYLESFFPEPVPSAAVRQKAA